MFIGMTEGCDSCVSIQTCTKCNCKSEVTAPESPDLWQHDANTAAEDTSGTASDAWAKRVAPAAISPPPDPEQSYQEMIEEPQTDLEGLGDEGFKPSFWMGGIGATLIVGSLLLEKGDLKHVLRGLGIVITGIGAANVVGTLVRQSGS